MKTTLEISTPLLRRAKKVAAAEGITLRALVEQGLDEALTKRSRRPVKAPPLVTFRGSGMNPEFAASGWDKVRDAIYEGRGS
jgi:hypothetical protein